MYYAQGFLVFGACGKCIRKQVHTPRFLHRPIPFRYVMTKADRLVHSAISPIDAQRIFGRENG